MEDRQGMQHTSTDTVPESPMDRPFWSVAVQALRSGSGMSEHAWAATLGVDEAAVHAWERGAAVPDASVEAVLTGWCAADGPSEPPGDQALGGLTLTPELLRDLLNRARAGVESAPRTTRTTSTGEKGAARVRPDLPTGTVTLLFTDIEGSTRLLQRLGGRYPAVLARHHALIRAAVASHGGIEMGTEGDAFFLVFRTAVQALAAAIAAQRALARYPWRADERVPVRMGLHTGEPVLTPDGYTGLDVHRVARITNLAHGGQILVSHATAELLRDTVADVALHDLGTHRLKDLLLPERLYQVTAPGLPADFPPLRSLGPPPSALLVPLTSFIGREREIAEIAVALERVRLLTLTGTGGTGKTRLALEAVRRLEIEEGTVAGVCADGVYVVDLAPVTDPALVGAAIARVLGMRDPTGPTLLQGLRAILESKRALLLLDNFEQVVGAAPLVTDLLHGCPELRVLITSRAPLRLSGEHEFPVTPLALPDAAHPAGVDDIAPTPAVALFVERARAVRPDFALTGENAADVAAICRHLDGLPLAIELAAPRVKTLASRDLLARLAGHPWGGPLRLLAAGARDLPARHQTLRAALAWSYDLLSDAEQRVFRRLSVFSGGWTLTAAEAVCAGDGIALPDVLDLLAALVEKSLVTVRDAAGAVRYGLLETVHAFGRELLMADAAEAAAVRGRQRDWCVAWVQGAPPAPTGPAHGAWLARVDAEIDNVRAALAWCLEAGDSEGVVAGLRLAGMLGPYWVARGATAEGADLLERLLTLPAAGAAPDAVQARALLHAGETAFMQARYDLAAERLAASLALYRAMGDVRGIADATSLLADIHQFREDRPGAIALLTEALGLYRQMGDESRAATMLRVLAQTLMGGGDLDGAVAHATEGLALFRRHGDHQGMMTTLGDLARVAMIRRDYERASTLFAEALAQHDDSVRRQTYANTLVEAGLVEAHLKRIDTALAYQRESLTLSWRAGALFGLNTSFSAMATTLWRAGRPALAARMAAAAEKLRDDLGTPLPPAYASGWRGLLKTLRRELGDHAFESAWAGGWALSPAEAVAEALQAEPTS